MDSSNKTSPAAQGGAKRFWTPARIVLTVVVLAALSALGLSSCNSNESNTNGVASSSPASGTTNPPRAANAPPPVVAPVALPQQVRDLKLQTIDGEALKLSDYADKVVVVNIWATWCGPCRTEMPDLVKLNHE